MSRFMINRCANPALVAGLLLLPGMVPLTSLSAEADAVAISRTIQQRHLPYGTIIDPVFATPQSNQITSYSRAADSAIWTGHYLAAEAFRYGTTRDPEALTNVRMAVAGLRSLVDVTGTDLLARCLFPVDSPYASAIIGEEAGHGIFTGSLGGQVYYWIGNTSRDQYSGVFFGLSVAFDLVDDPSVRGSIQQLVTRVLDFLLLNRWAVVMPDGRISTVFWVRPDQFLSFLQVGRQVNRNRFDSTYRAYRYWYASSVISPISLEVLDDHGSYFKFNLDTINLYNLIRLERHFLYRWWYTTAYDVLRRTLDDHGNPHFNMIDRGLKGANASRDSETRRLLDDWLQRPRRDDWIDWRGLIPSCGPADRACNPLSILDRVRTDFLWQRSPFLLFGGGAGTIEGSGIDYILPYWMARYYKVL